MRISIVGAHLSAASAIPIPPVYHKRSDVLNRNEVQLPERPPPLLSANPSVAVDNRPNLEWNFFTVPSDVFAQSLPEVERNTSFVTLSMSINGDAEYRRILIFGRLPALEVER